MSGGGGLGRGGVSVWQRPLPEDSAASARVLKAALAQPQLRRPGDRPGGAGAPICTCSQATICHACAFGGALAARAAGLTRGQR